MGEVITLSPVVINKRRLDAFFSDPSEERLKSYLHCYRAGMARAGNPPEVVASCVASVEITLRGLYLGDGQ